MIDHFTREEILGLKFLIVSVAMPAKARASNVSKCIDLWPSDESSKEFIKYQNLDLFRKNYFEDLDNSEVPIYKEILKPIGEDNKCLVIVCHENEDEMIDVLFEYLEKKYKLQAVDLNKLFTEGVVSPVKFNRIRIKNKVVDINRRVTKLGKEEKERSSGGRMMLLKDMTPKQKSKKLKSLGINPNNLSETEINKILIEEWVEE